MQASAHDTPVDLYYEERGAGSPVVVLHGLFGSSSNWRSFAKRLASDTRVLTLDLRNHGRSPHSAVHDYPSMAADVVAVLNRLGVSRASLVGHSMGGKVAMEVAMRYSERVERLVALDIAPRATRDGVREVLQVLLELDMKTVRSREDADALLAARLSDPALRSFLLMGLSRASDGTFRWKFNLAAIATSWAAIAAGVSPGRYEGPALFLRGEHSDHVRERDVPVILAYFPRARIATIPGAGHWLHVEASDETFDAVCGFVRESGR